MSLPSYINLSSKGDTAIKAAIVEVVTAAGESGIDNTTLQFQTSLLSSELYRLVNALVDNATLSIVRSGNGNFVVTLA